MEDPRELLIKVVKILDDLKIEYMITGGMAVFVWGHPRFTADVDIVVELAPSNITKLATALRSLEKAGYIEEDAMRDALRRRGEFNYISGELGLKVDFWVLGHDAADRARLKRKKMREMLGYDVAFIAPEDLIISKLKWYQKSWSEKHIDDARSVIAKSGKYLDYPYLNRQAAAQGLDEELEKLLK